MVSQIATNLTPHVGQVDPILDWINVFIVSVFLLLIIVSISLIPHTSLPHDDVTEGLDYSRSKPMWGN
jgi:hypothetical protein